MDNLSLVLVEIIKHLPGKHDQRDHANKLQSSLNKAPQSSIELRNKQKMTVKQLSELARDKRLPSKVTKRLTQAAASLDKFKSYKGSDMQAMIPHFREAWLAMEEANQYMKDKRVSYKFEKKG